MMSVLPVDRQGMRAIAAVVVLWATPTLKGDIVRATSRDELETALARARPGTTVRLASGRYRGGIAVAGLRGAEDRPIVIESEDPRKPAVIEGGASGLHLKSPEHVVVRNLEFSGAEANGVNIDDGGDRQRPARKVTLTGLVIRNNGPRGNRDGIKFSGVSEFSIEDCRVERWGTSGSAIDMVGCHLGQVTGCAFRHSGADTANGVQCKGGSSDIEIRRCRFENAGGRALNIGGNTGLDYFRPKPQGFEARNITVEDCTIVGSMSPIAFVGVDGATVRQNTIYAPSRWVVRILQENQDPSFTPCRNGEFSRNVIAFRSDEVRSVVNIGPGTAPETFVFRENVWHCLDRPDRTRQLVQLPTKETSGSYGIDPGFRNPQAGDYSFQNPAPEHPGARELPRNRRTNARE